ncbi:MAG: hypothetical protein Q9225_000869 [Loekoesia sp. 1 TL-2023]
MIAGTQQCKNLFVFRKHSIDLTENFTAKIDKLSIRGIRSFDNAQPEIIVFSTPLTLIVGYNGSGKTTIIESLKYATTGELPPNSKGGAFIHDPKLCGEKEVLAQVKLQFRDPSGAKLVVTRNVSLTVTKTNPKQKTLDVSLLRLANGERMVLSSRQAELDRFVPQYLGVSRAVLDNVIFCHQDESLWPMSEPSVLKKKFDEIFEAQKYTKAIENIKNVRKHYMDELKQLHITEQNCKVNKDRADRASQQSRALSDDIERLRAEVQNLDRLTREAKEKHQDAWDRSAKYMSVVEELKLKREKQQWLQEQIQTRARELKVRPESDDWLRNELDQYEERVRVHEDRKQQQSNKYDQLRRSIDNTREKLQRKHIEAGKYEQQQASHEQEIEARKNIIRESARQHNIRGYEADLDDNRIGEYMERLSKLYKDQTGNVDRVRAETDKEKQKVQEALSKIGERRSGFEEGKSSAKRQTLANDQKMASVQLELDAIEVDEGAEALCASKLEEISESLKQAKDQYKKSSWDVRLSEARSQSKTIEEEVEQANQELVQSTNHFKDLAQLEYLKKELSGRKRSLETLMGVHNERLRSIVGTKWQPASLEKDFQGAVEQRSRNLKAAENRRNASAKDLDQTEFKLRSRRDDFKKAEKELRECARLVTDATGEDTPDTYPAVLQETQDNRDTLKADMDDFAITRKLYKKSIKTAQTKGRCELCERNFHGQSEKSEFVQKMEEKIQENTLQELENQFKDQEKELQKMRSVGSSYSNWLQVSNSELPRLRSEIQQLEQSKATLVRQSEDYDKDVADQEDKRRDAESLSKPVSSIVQFQADISSFAKQIKELSTAQEDAGISRAIDEIQEQLTSLNAQTRAQRNLIEKLTSEKQHGQSNISTKELSLSTAKNELSTATHQLEKRSELAKQIEDLRKSNQEHRDTIKRLDEQIQALSPQISELETKYDDIKQRGVKRERELQQVADKLSDSLHKLRAAEQNIQAYTDSGGSSRLDRSRRDILDFQQEIEKTEVEQKQIISEINKVSEELRNHQDTRRTIIENLNYRRSKRELEDVEEQISRLSGQNAEADLEYLQEQQRYWENQWHKHTTEKSSKLATMKAKDDQLQELLKDWKTDYQNAAQEYKEAHIKVETTKAAIEDLARYGNALDKAIMQYHSLKMEEINRIAEELWKRTYQGTDVDTILIRSDHATAGGNRSYNYRVCMVKQDAEMDMRGRCSAGQRVLASIIIRLALAECFGVKCGLIALDEPTTNLDRDNIRSLAESLHDIIRARQQQSNFQLIVITHDEEFLQYMQCADFCDTYYRISRTDRQKSRIERQSITDVV